MGRNPEDMFGDEDYPACTIGQAAEMLGTTQDFLRRLDEAKLIDPHRSSGGHRRYSRYQLRRPPGPAKWSTRAPPWRRPAGSSSWKTNSRKPSDRTKSSSVGRWRQDEGPLSGDVLGGRSGQGRRQMAVDRLRHARRTLELGHHSGVIPVRVRTPRSGRARQVPCPACAEPIPAASPIPTPTVTAAA